MPDPAISVMGTWAAGDPMPGVYDSVVSSAELTHKNFVRSNYADGWRMVSHGMVAEAAYFPFNGSAQPSGSGARVSETMTAPALCDAQPEPDLVEAKAVVLRGREFC